MIVSKRRSILMIAFCVIVIGGCTRSQSTYYVDPGGDDTRDGKTPATAWRTLSRVNSVTYGAGDRVLLKRGGVWHEALRLTGSGASGNPITYADYGSGPKPVIDLGGSLPGWSTRSNWTDQGGNVWSMAASFPGRMWFKRPEFNALKEFGLPGFSNATGTWSHDFGSNVVDSRYRWWWSDGTLYVYAIGNPADYYTDIQIAIVIDENNWSGKSYVTFKNLEFRRGHICIELNNCSYITFDSCKILGGTSAYGIWAKNGSDHGVVTNHCILDREDTVKHQMEYGGSSVKGNGQDAIALQSGSYWDIGYSYFGGTSHAGVEISGEILTGYRSNYNKVHDNELYGGGDYDRAFLCQGYNANDWSDSSACWYAHHNEFYRNYIHGMETVSSVGSIYTKVYYNIFADQGHIWWDTLDASGPYMLGVWRSSALECSSVYPCYNLQVFNNTFMNLDAQAYRLWVDATYPFAHGYNSIKNNVIYNAGRLNNPLIPYSCFEISTGMSGDTIQNNIIYSPYSTSTCTVYEWSYQENPPAKQRTVAYLNAQNGTRTYKDNQSHTRTSTNVISGNLAVDPRLLPDAHIAFDSPARDAGIPVGLSKDFFGNPIPPGARPDIGACEVAPGSEQAGVDPPNSPAAYVLQQNYPNPFNPSTVIRYEVPRESRVLLEVFNIIGQSVTKLVDAVVAAGAHEVRFDGNSLAAGMYFYRLAVEGGAPLVRKMSIIK